MVVSDPEDPTRTRYRSSFYRDGRTIRLCTPLVKKWEQGKRARFGPLLDEDKLFREWHLEQLRRAETRPSGIDVAAFPPTAEIPIKPLEDWFMLPKQHSVSFDEWALAAQSLCAYHGIGAMLPNQLERALRPDPPITFAEGARKSHLLVAFDLRVPLDDQLSAAKGRLLEVQSFLHRLTGISVPRAARRQESRWRNIYIYLLWKVHKAKPPQIAAHVFHDEWGDGRTRDVPDPARRLRVETRRRAIAVRVRKILTQMDEAVRAAKADAVRGPLIRSDVIP